ncbi:MAG: transposase [Carbonactinosporaceae bacterium]
MITWRGAWRSDEQSVGPAGAVAVPQGKKPGCPPVWTRRQLIDGIRWRTRTGAPWRDVPSGTARGTGSTTCYAAGSGTAPGPESSPSSRLRPTPRA